MKDKSSRVVRSKSKCSLLNFGTSSTVFFAAFSISLIKSGLRYKVCYEDAIVMLVGVVPKGISKSVEGGCRRVVLAEGRPQGKSRPSHRPLKGRSR